MVRVLFEEMQLHIPGPNINSLPYEPTFSLAKVRKLTFLLSKKLVLRKVYPGLDATCMGVSWTDKKRKLPVPYVRTVLGQHIPSLFLAPDQKRKFPF
jgi:hypothetical protein